MSYGGHWDGRLPVPATEIGTSMLLVHSPGVLHGVRGRAVKSVEHYLLGLKVHESRFSICVGDRCEGRCEREAEVVPLEGIRLGVQAIVA